MAPSDASLRTDLPPLSSQQRGWIDRAIATIDEDFLDQALTRMVETPSQTGSERAVAELVVEMMRERGIDASYQPIDDNRGNGIGRVRGTGDGPDTLLYGQLDTTFTNDRREDLPVLGDADRPDLEAHITRRDGLICGNGVSNPKGGNACALAAVDAVIRARVPLAGDVILGFVSGGVHKRPIDGLARSYVGSAYQGFGIGCEYMLKHGVCADYAINTKPGYGIAWEEPGECWFMVEVRGVLCYSGMRHLQPHRNPIVDAAALAIALEAWIPDYTKEHTLGQLAPQGAVGSIEGGWPFKPEFIPSLCRIYVNLHTNAAERPAQIRREFGAFIDRFRAEHPDIELSWDMLQSMAGSRTEPSNWIVQSCWRAWEEIEGEPHTPPRGMSGTTDGNVLRLRGIPTVRIGLPGLISQDGSWPPFFDAVRATDLARLTKVYIHALIDTCTRTRDEVA